MNVEIAVARMLERARRREARGAVQVITPRCVSCGRATFPGRALCPECERRAEPGALDFLRIANHPYERSPE